MKDDINIVHCATMPSFILDGQHTQFTFLIGYNGQPYLIIHHGNFVPEDKRVKGRNHVSIPIKNFDDMDVFAECVTEFMKRAKAKAESIIKEKQIRDETPD